MADGTLKVGTITTRLDRDWETKLPVTNVTVPLVK